MLKELTIMLIDLIWDLDPVILTLGSLQLRWFTLFLVVGVLLGRFLFFRNLEDAKLTAAEGSSIFNYSLLGALVGSRLFYFLFFEPQTFASNPLQIVFPFEWKGGFRFEGASEFSLTGELIGLLISLFIYSKVKGMLYSISLNKGLLVFIVIGIFIGVGNFFQSENYGTPTDAPIGVLFANRIEKKLMRTSCCVMRIPNGKNPLDKAIVKAGKVLAHEATGYKPIIIYLFFTEGATEQLVNEFLIGDVKTSLYELSEVVFESGDEPLHYNIYEEGKGKYMARIQSIGIARHPLQLYETLGFLLVGFGLVSFSKKEKISLALFLMVAVIAIIHFGLGFLATDRGVVIPQLSISVDQLTCAAGVLLFVFLGWISWNKIKA